MKQHRKLHVTGKVQGVWYRQSTRNKAHALGIRGFVRNEADGSVYIEAEGSEDQLNELESWCWQGPPEAEVDGVATTAGEVKDLGAFGIRYA